MGYVMIKNNNSYLPRFKKFYCDFLEDIKKLPTSKKIGAKQINDTVSDDPCAPGSECFCYEDNSIWLLGVETDEWVKIGYRYDISSGGSGNTGSDGNTNPSITSYNQLNDIPMKNITPSTSTPLVLSNLEPGIYKLTGNYSVIPNSKNMSTKKSGNIFIVSDGRIMEIASDGITLFDIQSNDTYTTNTYTTTDSMSEEILKQLNSDVFNTELEDKISKNLSYATNDDIDNLF